MPRRRMPVISRMLTAAALALLAGACSDQPFDASPARSPAGAVRSAASPAEPPLIANAVKYADRGAKPATGRSGSAALSARALIGKDGQTVLEVTTGELDASAPAPGTLAKLQVKQFTPKDEPLRTLNYNNLPGGGSVAYSYGGLVRGAKLQVQANVRGIDPRRTDVVTVTEAVRLRPDLRVRLDAPEKARPGIPVNIAAVVLEGNGEVGARANCVLYVDGVEADRANGIWVDAGDAVSCAFSHVFQAPGTKRLRVAVTGVVPGDFDLADNSAEGTIQIADRFSYYYASVQDNVARTRYHTVSSWTGTWGWNSESTQDFEYLDTFQSAYLYAVIPAQLSLPLTRIEMSQSTNGAPVHSAVLTDLAGDELGYGSWYPCVSRRMGAGTVVNVCSIPAPFRESYLNYQRYAGLTTYQGSQYTRQWYSDGGPEYVYFSNQSGEYRRQGDPLTTIGSDYTFSVEVTDGGRIYSIEQTVAMGPVKHSSWPVYGPSGEFCWQNSYPEGVSKGCTRGEVLYSDRLGSSWGDPD